MRKITVAAWLHRENLNCDEAAEKYTIGQKLNMEQAKEIRNMVAKSVGCNLDAAEVRDDWQKLGSSYRKFIYKYVLLLASHKARRSTWRQALWNALEDDDKTIANTLSNNKLVEEKKKKMIT